jgi:hypothetical protein
MVGREPAQPRLLLLDASAPMAFPYLLRLAVIDRAGWWPEYIVIRYY